MVKKILFYDIKYPDLQQNSDIPVGGATVQLHSWIKGFSSVGWKIGVLVPQKTKKSLDSKVQFIETFDLNFGIPKIRYFFYKIPKLFFAIKRYKPDYLYHGLPGPESMLLLLICKILRIKFILRISNDNIVDERMKKKFSNTSLRMLKYVYKHSHYVVCQNSYQFDMLKQTNKTKLLLITNPFYFTHIRKNITTANVDYIAWVGLFQYQKNIPDLLKITKKLPNVQFKIAGCKSGDFSRGNNAKINLKTQEALDALKECKNVEFVGFLKRKQVINFLSNAKLLLNTSHYEGFSNTFLESFSVGTPVVCPINIDPSGIIEKYKLGATFNSLGDAVDKVLEIKLSNRSFLENIIKYLSGNHAPKKLTKELINHLENK